MNISLKVNHIPGKGNVIADLVSRWNSHPNASATLHQLLPIHRWAPVKSCIHRLVHIINMYVFLGLHPTMALLLHLGLQKTRMAFRPATDRNYIIMFRLFIYNIYEGQIVLLALIAYLQFLETNNTAPLAMANRLSAIKAKLSLYFQNAMVLYRPFKANLKRIIDIETLHLMISICDSTYMRQVFKAIYTIAVFIPSTLKFGTTYS